MFHITTAVRYFFFFLSENDTKKPGLQKRKLKYGTEIRRSFPNDVKNEEIAFILRFTSFYEREMESKSDGFSVIFCVSFEVIIFYFYFCVIRSLTSFHLSAQLFFSGTLEWKFHLFYLSHKHFYFTNFFFYILEKKNEGRKPFIKLITS